MFKLLVASHNSGKVAELRALLGDQVIDLSSLTDFENIIEVKETGTTFAENAALKASSYAIQTGFWTLADDSGLEVAALNYKPGVYSARYAGKNASDSENIHKLVTDIKKTGGADRRAQFVCAMCIADPAGKIQIQADGVCRGKVVLSPIGTYGFGYDPIFVPDGFDKSFGELPDAIKTSISHRAIAAKRILEYLPEITVS